MKCDDCNIKTGKKNTFEFIDEYEELYLCQKCHDIRFEKKVSEGIEVFYYWADYSYGKDVAEKLAKNIFGEVEMNNFLISAWKNANNSMITMFTYGILKYPHNITREGGIDIVENCIVKGHEMYLHAGAFPITKVTDNENQSIFGTLFKVPAHVVHHSYDHTEGYSPRRSKEQNMYNREEVDVITPDGTIIKANMYIANPLFFTRSYGKDNLLPTGNFDDRPKAKKIIFR